MTEPQPQPEPEPSLVGRFAVYNLPDQSIILAVELKGQDGVIRHVVPGPIAAGARALLEGGEITPRDLWRALQSARRWTRDAVPS